MAVGENAFGPVSGTRREMRLKEESATIWDAFPAELVDVALFVTDLGGTEGIILLLSLLYWLVDRKRAATVASYAVAGAVFIIFIKALIGLPRPVPDEAMAVESVVSLEDDPHGFPSGHAFTAVVVYGGLVRVFDRGRDPVALAAAGTLIVTISLTRIVLRLHYLGDVLAGAALGAGFLLAIHAIAADRPGTGFAVGIAIAIPAVLVTGFEEYALVGLGSGIGGLVASQFLDAVPVLRSRTEGALLTVCGLGYVVVVLVLKTAVAGSDPAGQAAVVVFHTALIAGILLVPVVVNPLESYRQRLLPVGRQG